MDWRRPLDLFSTTKVPGASKKLSTITDQLWSGEGPRDAVCVASRESALVEHGVVVMELIRVDEAYRCR